VLLQVFGPHRFIFRNLFVNVAIRIVVWQDAFLDEISVYLFIRLAQLLRRAWVTCVLARHNEGLRVDIDEVNMLGL